MFPFHWIKCVIVSASSFKKPVTHFSIQKPSSSSLVVVIQQISPAATSCTALNLESNNFNTTSAGFAVGLAALIMAYVPWVGSSLHKRLDGLDKLLDDLEKPIVTKIADLENLMIANKLDLDKRLDGMDQRLDRIHAELKGLNTSFITYLGTKKK